MLVAYLCFYKNLLQTIYAHPVLLQDYPYLEELMEADHYPLLPSSMRRNTSDRRAHSHAFASLNQKFAEYQKYRICLQFIVDNYHYYRELLCLEARTQLKWLEGYYEDLYQVTHQLNRIADAAEACRMSPSQCRFIGQYFVPTTMPPTSKPLLLEPAFCPVPPATPALTPRSVKPKLPEWVQYN